MGDASNHVHNLLTRCILADAFALSTLQDHWPRRVLAQFRHSAIVSFCEGQSAKAIFSHVQVQRSRSHGRLPDFNEVAVRVAHVAADFCRVHLRLGDEFRSARRPNLAAAPDVRHAKVEKIAQ